MRSTDERMNAVERRARELKQEQKIRRSRMISLSAIAAAIALVVGTGFSMPGIMGQLNVSEHLGMNGMASIFSEGSGIGYVLIALLAFALGVCITMLCLHLHHTAKKSDSNEAEGEERNG